MHGTGGQYLSSRGQQPQPLPHPQPLPLPGHRRLRQWRQRGKGLQGRQRCELRQLLERKLRLLELLLVLVLVLQLLVLLLQLQGLLLEGLLLLLQLHLLLLVLLLLQRLLLVLLLLQRLLVLLRLKGRLRRLLLWLRVSRICAQGSTSSMSTRAPRSTCTSAGQGKARTLTLRRIALRASLLRRRLRCLVVLPLLLRLHLARRSAVASSGRRQGWQAATMDMSADGFLLGFVRSTGGVNIFFARSERNFETNC